MEARSIKYIDPDVIDTLQEGQLDSHLQQMGLQNFGRKVDWTDTNGRCKDSLVLEFVKNFVRLEGLPEGVTTVQGQTLCITRDLLGSTFHLVDNGMMPDTGRRRGDKNQLKFFGESPSTKKSGYGLKDCTDALLRIKLKLHCNLLLMQPASGMPVYLLQDVENSVTRNWYLDFCNRLLHTLEEAAQYFRPGFQGTKESVFWIGAQVRALLLASNVVADLSPASNRMAHSSPAVSSDPVASTILALSPAADAGQSLLIEEMEKECLDFLESNHSEHVAGQPMLTEETGNMSVEVEVAHDNRPIAQAREEKAAESKEEQVNWKASDQLGKGKTSVDGALLGTPDGKGEDLGDLSDSSQSNGARQACVGARVKTLNRPVMLTNIIENNLDQKHDKKQARRKKNYWTTEEEDALKAGVERFGKGKWKVIKMWKGQELKDCTEVDLKDKMVNLEKKRKKEAEAHSSLEKDPNTLPKRDFKAQIV